MGLGWGSMRAPARIEREHTKDLINWHLGWRRGSQPIGQPLVLTIKYIFD